MASPVRTEDTYRATHHGAKLENNCYLDEEKSQRNTAQFSRLSLGHLSKQTSVKLYSLEVFKLSTGQQWFNLNQDTLRDALQITPVDNNRAFSSPPTPDTLVEFVNELGQEGKLAQHTPREKEINSHPNPKHQVSQSLNHISPATACTTSTQSPNTPLHLPTEEPVTRSISNSVAKG
ncbi:hypothetical protein Tco_0528758 [Tanacetum coccineum]